MRKLVVLLAAALAGCSQPAAPVYQPPAAGLPVVLRFGDRTATATLTDTPEARQLAAMLPVTVEMKDVWAQAKAGPLPHALTVEGTATVHDPVPGDIYFRPQTEVVAVYYHDLGQAVPDPGLIRLGTLDSGLDALGDSGEHLTVRIEPA